ncbi:methyltransferase domain-containing protein [Candidatus Pacearchaeota archaeon]|nr:methyltransferase domain-containing protein [Candidatus Pacearchaeota archaeon]
MKLTYLNQEEIHPNPNVVEALKFIDNNINKEKKLKVLDIGAADGKDSFFLAKQGFDISAIDTSSYFIHKINQLARIHNVEIRSTVANALTYNFEDYNIIICNNVLHFLQSDQIKFLIKKIQYHTLPKGLIIISYINNDILKNLNIEELFKDWEILYYNENLFSSSNKKKVKKFIEFIAKKKEVL